MIEEAVGFGANPTLWGVLTRPEPPTENPCGVVLLNAGLVHRAGPHRLYVDLARGLAAMGLTTLRFDFSSVGDSEPRSDCAPFEVSAVEEVRAAMDWLQEHSACRHFILGGLCAGAEIAFKTAGRDSRVSAAMLINAPRYEQEPDPAIVARVDERQRAHQQVRVAIYDWDRWKRLLTGRVDYRSLIISVGRHLVEAIRSLRGGARAFNPDIQSFAALEERGVRLLLLFSEADWGVDYVATVLGEHLKEPRAAAQVTLQTIEAADHTFTPLASRNRARAAILAWVRSLLIDSNRRIQPLPRGLER